MSQAVRNLTVFVLLCHLLVSITGAPPDAVFDQSTLREGVDEPVQKWGYVEVRPHAHMFWWLYRTTAKEGYMNRPLVIWLQGGPGASGTGFGNFQELGPEDINQNARNTTWVSRANVMFIDNPVGTGYSYVTSDDAYTTDVAQIADDLVFLFKEFSKAYPEFQKIPLYIFCESYGGKMTAAFAQALYKSINHGDVHANFKGVALGDSWISPVDYVMTWGPYLYATSLVETESLARITAVADQCRTAYFAGNYTQSTALWSKLEGVINQETGGVNFYNILKWGQSDFSKQKAQSNSYLSELYNRHVAPMANDALSEFMNGPMRKKLTVIPKNVTWGGQSGEVFAKQSGDFMKPVIDIVADLLSNTDLQVVVFNGQLDLICDTMGTELWVQRLSWPGLEAYNAAPRKPLTDRNQVPWGYLKQHKNFSFYWVLGAGHMVPQDVGEAALTMLEMIIG